jgi:hypothetical protein
MGLIYKSYLLTLNQRVQGSGPCAPTNHFNGLAGSRRFIPTRLSAVIAKKWLIIGSSTASPTKCSPPRWFLPTAGDVWSKSSLGTETTDNSIMYAAVH